MSALSAWSFVWHFGFEIFVWNFVRICIWITLCIWITQWKNKILCWIRLEDSVSSDLRFTSVSVSVWVFQLLELCWKIQMEDHNTIFWVCLGSQERIFWVRLRYQGSIIWVCLKSQRRIIWVCFKYQDTIVWICFESQGRDHLSLLKMPRNDRCS